MPSIKPKSVGQNFLLSLGGQQGFQNRLAASANDRADAYADRDAERAERERERHEFEIERVKRRQAEEDNERLLAEQEQAAAREAAQWSIQSARQGIEKVQGGKPLPPQLKERLDRASTIADKLSPQARQQFLGEVQSEAVTAQLDQARAQATNRISDTIRDLSGADFDTGPLVEQLQGAVDAIQAAETPAQVQQAIQVGSQAAAQARAAVTKQHVEADVRAATIQNIQSMYSALPGKAAKASALARAVQFGGMKPEEALKIAVNDVHGLTPPTAQERAVDFARNGGSYNDLFSTPHGRQAFSVFSQQAQDRALAQMKQMLPSDATWAERKEFIREAMPEMMSRVLAEHGIFAEAYSVDQRMPVASGQEAERPPKVPLEQVRSVMPGGDKLAKPAQGDPVATAQAVAREIKARAAKEGWDRAKTEAEIEAALKDMGLID